MKKILTSLCLFFYVITAYAQTVALQRTSELMPEIYPIDGQAFLEELSDGNLILRLSEDFDTPAGPDVRILLGNTLSQSGTVEIINLTTISHFSGANTFAVPSDINISDFDRILFFCVQFNQFWASGSFGDTVDPNAGNFVCEESSILIADGSNQMDICSTDAVDDLINFSNSLNQESGVNYAYLLTDENDILQEVLTSESFNFEGSTAANQRVHGIHFEGTLMPAIGSDRLATTATGCARHSENTGFVTITKTGECEAITSTHDTFLENAIDIFPNPSDGHFSINYNDVSVESVQLFDNSGRLVQKYSNINQFEVLNAGLYFIRFITEDSSATKRIFVK